MFCQSDHIFLTNRYVQESSDFSYNTCYIFLHFFVRHNQYVRFLPAFPVAQNVPAKRAEMSPGIVEDDVAQLLECSGVIIQDLPVD